VKLLRIQHLVILFALVLVAAPPLAGTALGQAATETPAATSTPAPGGTATPATSATGTPVPAASISTSPSQAAAGTSVTVNGTGFQPGETVNVSFNGNQVGTPTADTSGNFSQGFTVPSNLAPGNFGLVATGQRSNRTANASFTVSTSAAGITLSATQGAAGSAFSLTASGFRPGETVNVTFNGTNIGSETADVNGGITTNLTVPSIAPGQYNVVATGETSGTTQSANYTVIAATPAATPAATAQATASPAATAQPTANAAAAGNAPAVAHDDRYFSQTGYRVDNDQVWTFFQQYGGINAFGYPTSRTFTFLGCPVQFFQRQIIQVCSGQGAALINMLDPEIFPYTKVNGSTFPGPDDQLKASTPPVSDPNYAANITTFVQQNVPDTANGQPVNFLQQFNQLGGLNIWGAPISHPAPDPSNGNFVYQRFQRGIMHYIAGQGTESILLADYLKAIIMNQNVPSDLLAQAQGSKFFNQYCPGSDLWLCRPADLSGTDFTFAFVQG
jgi:hypothetical protein